MAKIKHRPTQIQCEFCGKSFYEEKYLDLHFDNRHKEKVNHAEDAICLADYCDILRCDVLVTKNSFHDNSENGNNNPTSTDIEIYNEATALATARRVAAKSDIKSFNLPPSLREKLRVLLSATGHKIETPPPKEKIHKRRRNICSEQSKKLPNEDAEGKDPSNSSCEMSPADRRYNRFSEIQRLKANCKNDNIQKVKSRCEGLIRTCIASALVQLSVEDFKNMERK